MCNEKRTAEAGGVKEERLNGEPAPNVGVCPSVDCTATNWLRQVNLACRFGFRNRRAETSTRGDTFHV